MYTILNTLEKGSHHLHKAGMKVFVMVNIRNVGMVQ